MKRKVVLVGWEGADWRLINPLLDAGRMPYLASLVERGVMGHIATLTPPVAPLLWTSIATGVTADRHGVLGFVEPDPVTGGLRPVSCRARRVKAVWNILNQSGLHAHAAGWFASEPGNTPADLKVQPGDLTGDDLLPFVPNLASIDQDKDHRLIPLALALSDAITTHAAATWVLETQPWDFVGVYFDAIGRSWREYGQYHPPRRADITEQDFDTYQHVVARVHRYQDLMLGRLIELAGPEAVVMIVSDHGLSASRGIFAASGPGIRHDELVFGAGLLDIAPTILAMYGLPAGEDMPGRVLAEAFEKPAAIPERIASWESAAEDTAPDDPWDATAAIEQLAELGYVDAPAEQQKQVVREARAQERLNLAQVHLAAGRAEEAAELFEELRSELPGIDRLDLHLAQAYFQGGALDRCRAVAEKALGGADGGAADLLMGALLLTEGKTQEGLAHLLEAERAEEPAPAIRSLIGHVYLLARRWTDAERALRAAIDADPMFEPARLGLARALLETGRIEAAADSALQAVALRYEDPDAHLVLGMALARLGRLPRALQAFETSRALRPPKRAVRS